MTSQSAAGRSTARPTGLLGIPAVDRTRRNHGLEHATITILSQRIRGVSLVGRSTPNGFHLYGNVGADDVSWAAPAVSASATESSRGGSVRAGGPPA